MADKPVVVDGKDIINFYMADMHGYYFGVVMRFPGTDTIIERRMKRSDLMKALCQLKFTITQPRKYEYLHVVDPKKKGR